MGYSATDRALRRKIGHRFIPSSCAFSQTVHRRHALRPRLLYLLWTQGPLFGHPGSFKSAYDLACVCILHPCFDSLAEDMAPLLTSTQIPCQHCRSGDRTLVVGMGGQFSKSVNPELLLFVRWKSENKHI